MSANPRRAFPEMEISVSLDSFGSWLGWIGNGDMHGIAALSWMASQGDEFPEELEGLRVVIAQFGHAPIEQVTKRVVGLEAAFAEIAGLLEDWDGTKPAPDRIREIVEVCVKFSGDYGVERAPFSAIFDRAVTEEVAP